jgi:hypothetical protein
MKIKASSRDFFVIPEKAVIQRLLLTTVFLPARD